MYAGLCSTPRFPVPRVSCSEKRAGEAVQLPNDPSSIWKYREVEDAPLESVDTVWAVRAPVDVFVSLANLLGPEHFIALGQVVEGVFAQINPASALAIEDRPFARMLGANMPHFPWLREGLANTLLMIAVIPVGSAPDLFHMKAEPQLSFRACDASRHVLNAPGNNLSVRRGPTPHRSAADRIPDYSPLSSGQLGGICEELGLAGWPGVPRDTISCSRSHLLGE